MDVLRSVQKKHQREPTLTPKPCNNTRWNGRHDKTKHANIIMGDVCLTIKFLLRPNGDDRDLLTANEKEDENFDRLTYTDHDKMWIYF